MAHSTDKVKPPKMSKSVRIMVETRNAGVQAVVDQINASAEYLYPNGLTLDELAKLTKAVGQDVIDNQRTAPDKLMNTYPDIFS